MCTDNNWCKIDEHISNILDIKFLSLVVVKSGVHIEMVINLPSSKEMMGLAIVSGQWLSCSSKKGELG